MVLFLSLTLCPPTAPLSANCISGKFLSSLRSLVLFHLFLASSERANSCERWIILWCGCRFFSLLIHAEFETLCWWQLALSLTRSQSALEFNIAFKQTSDDFRVASFRCLLICILFKLERRYQRCWTTVRCRLLMDRGIFFCNISSIQQLSCFFKLGQ